MRQYYGTPKVVTQTKKSWGSLADCPAMSFVFVCYIRNTNQLSWAINWGRGGADTGWTNDVKRLEALTMTEQII